MPGFDKKDTQEKIKKIVSEKLQLSFDKIDGSSTLQDLGADSLDMAEITIKLEEQFGVEIDDEKAENLQNIDSVIDYVHELRTK